MERIPQEELVRLREICERAGIVSRQVRVFGLLIHEHRTRHSNQFRSGSGVTETDLGIGPLYGDHVLDLLQYAADPYSYQTQQMKLPLCKSFRWKQIVDAKYVHVNTRVLISAEAVVAMETRRGFLGDLMLLNPTSLREFAAYTLLRRCALGHSTQLFEGELDRICSTQTAIADPHDFVAQITRTMMLEK